LDKDLLEGYSVFLTREAPMLNRFTTAAKPSPPLPTL
jgi:hypothetical protein